MAYTFFISCVSVELAEWRMRLTECLRGLTRSVNVQEDFVPMSEDALIALDSHIRKCDKMIHIVGAEAGSIPDIRAIKQLLNLRPDLLRMVPALADASPNFEGISYTFWEAWLALYHMRQLVVFVPADGSPEAGPLVAKHIERLGKARRPARRVDNIDHLIIDVLRSEELRHDRLAEPFDTIRQLRLEGYDEDIGGQMDKRRAVVGTQAAWNFLREGRYASRPELLKDMYEAFERWWQGDAQANSDQFSVFWLEGRSGDGKSVALLQLAELHMLLCPDAIVVRLTDPSRLPEVMRWLQPSSTRALILIDDLHRVTNLDDLPTRLHGVLEEGCAPIPILACGPTPERQAFAHAHRRLFTVTPRTVRGATTLERTTLCEWFGKPPPGATDSNSLLVEFLFELRVGEPIQTFSKNFLARLEQVGVLPAMKSVLAVNALDIAAPQSVLEEGRGRDFIERLADADQGHFKLDSLLPDGEAGLRFSHNRIAWRVFWEWTHDPLIGRDEKPMAQALHPVLRAVQASVPNRTAIINALFDRWRTIQENDTAAPTRLADALLARLGHDPGVELAFLTHLFHAYNRTNTRCGSAAIFSATRRILDASPCMSWLSCAMAAGWLARLSQEPEFRAPGDEALCWTVLNHAGNVDYAGGGLVSLASRKETANAWVPRLGEWLGSNGLASSASLAWAWALSRTPQDKDIQLGALEWCKSHDQTQGVHQLLAQLVSVTPQEETTRALALEWCSKNAQTQGVYQLLAQLVSAAPQDERIRARALEWCAQNAQTQGVHQLLAQLVSVAPQDERIRGRALRWCAQNSQTQGVHQLLAQLVIVAPQDERIHAQALRWCTDHAQTKGVHQLLARLVSAAPQDETIRAQALEWCAKHAQTNGVHELLRQIVSIAHQNERIRAQALEWCAQNTQTEGVHELLAQLVSVAPEDEKVRAQAVAWCSSNLGSKGVHRLITLLIESKADDPDIISITWRIAQTTSPNAAASRNLARLLRTDGSASPVEITRIEDALGGIPESREKEAAQFEFILSLAAANEPLKRILAHLQTIGDRTSAVHYRARELTGLLRNAPNNERVIDLLLALKQANKGPSSLRLVAARAAASAVEVVLEAVMRRPSDARDLLYLVAVGASHAPGLDQRLLNLQTLWPRDHLGFFWRAVLSCRNIPPDKYMLRLVATLNASHHPNQEILRSLALRPDYASNFEKQMPSHIANLVTLHRIKPG